MSGPLHVQVMRLAEDQISGGVRDLSLVTPAGTNVNERAYHIVQLICVAVQLLTWAVSEEHGQASEDSCFIDAICVTICTIYKKKGLRSNFICLSLSLSLSLHPALEIESALQRLSTLLTVHTPKFNILVTPLRAAILEVWSTQYMLKCLMVNVLFFFSRRE